jgi:hypothetical protein
MQHRGIDGENEVVAQQSDTPEEKVLNENGDVSQRQFYRPSGSHFRPSYNHGLNAPIRPGHYNIINHALPTHRPYRPSAIRPPNHIYNSGYHR